MKEHKVHTDKEALEDLPYNGWRPPRAEQPPQRPLIYGKSWKQRKKEEMVALMFIIFLLLLVQGLWELGKYIYDQI